MAWKKYIFVILLLQTQEDKYRYWRQERRESLYYWGIKMKSTEILLPECYNLVYKFGLKLGVRPLLNFLTEHIFFENLICCPNLAFFLGKSS